MICPYLQTRESEASEGLLRKQVKELEQQKASAATTSNSADGESKQRINQLLEMLREAEETAGREAEYHERLISQLRSRLALAESSTAGVRLFARTELTPFLVTLQQS